VPSFGALVEAITKRLDIPVDISWQVKFALWWHQLHFSIEEPQASGLHRFIF
jgi:hypothetical protein